MGLSHSRPAHFNHWCNTSFSTRARLRSGYFFFNRVHRQAHATRQSNEHHSITPRTRSHRLRPHREDRPPASATHRPDVAVRIRPQLARSVPLRVHPPPAGGSYIPHAPTRKINNKRRNSPVRARPRTRFVRGPTAASSLVQVLGSNRGRTQALRPTQQRDVSMQR